MILRVFEKIAPNNQEKVTKNLFFRTLSETLGGWGLKSPNLFSENIRLVILTANIQKCPKIYNTKWGGHI